MRYLTACALPAASAVLGSRYCDICGWMPWWEQLLLVIIGLFIAIAILAGFLRLSTSLSRRRRPPTPSPDPPDDDHATSD